MRPHIVKTYGLTLEEFVQFHSLSLWEFWQFSKFTDSTDGKLPRDTGDTANCHDVVYQLKEYKQEFNRYCVSRAIADAEKALVEYLGYYPFDQYIEWESHEYRDNTSPSVNDHNLYYEKLNQQFPHWGEYAHSYCTRYGSYSFNTKRPVKKVGKREIVSLGTNLEPTIYATMGGTPVVNDGFYVDVPITEGDDIDEVHLFYASSVVPERSQDLWEIYPSHREVLTVDDILVVRCYGLVHQLVKPELWMTWKPKELTINTESNYITAIDAVLYTYNSCEAVRFRYPEDCDEDFQQGCATILNYDNGLILPIPTMYDEEEVCHLTHFDNGCGYRKPRDVEICYVSKSQLTPHHQYELKEAIAYLAASYLDCFPCNCDCGGCEESLKKYSKPPVFDAGERSGKMIYQFQKIESNPFGGTLGGIRAWELVRHLKRTKPIALEG